MELQVSRVTKELIRDFVLDFFPKMGIAACKMGDVLIWEAGPDGAGVYVGKLNGQPITCVSMIQHSKSYAWVGFYYCEEEHRGKGYAFKTWKIARTSLNPGTNVGLDSFISAASMYESEGFKRAWIISFEYFSVSSILEAYKDLAIPDECTIVLATSVDFQKLKFYVEDVIGINFSQDGFLEKLITLPTHTALVAVKEDGDIIGFAAFKESLAVDKSGYPLAPLLADSGDIARQLLLKLAQKVHPKQKFAICLTSDINEDAKSIASEVKGTKISTFVRMYTKGEPPIKKAKYFGAISELVG